MLVHTDTQKRTHIHAQGEHIIIENSIMNALHYLHVPLSLDHSAGLAQESLLDQQNHTRSTHTQTHLFVCIHLAGGRTIFFVRVTYAHIHTHSHTHSHTVMLLLLPIWRQCLKMSLHLVSGKKGQIQSTPQHFYNSALRCTSQGVSFNVFTRVLHPGHEYLGSSNVCTCVGCVYLCVSVGVCVCVCVCL